MKPSPFTPTWRSGLVLSVGFAVAAVVLPLIPDRDDPRVSSVQVGIAVLMALVTAATGLFVLWQGRAMDRVLTVLTVAAVAGIFYQFIHRAA